MNRTALLLLLCFATLSAFSQERPGPGTLKFHASAVPAGYALGSYEQPLRENLALIFGGGLQTSALFRLREAYLQANNLIYFYSARIVQGFAGARLYVPLRMESLRPFVDFLAVGKFARFPERVIYPFENPTGGYNHYRIRAQFAQTRVLFGFREKSRRLSLEAYTGMGFGIKWVQPNPVSPPWATNLPPDQDLRMPNYHCLTLSFHAGISLCLDFGEIVRRKTAARP